MLMGRSSISIYIVHLSSFAACQGYDNPARFEVTITVLILKASDTYHTRPLKHNPG
jgi:hypothetical protein